MDQQQNDQNLSKYDVEKRIRGAVKTRGGAVTAGDVSAETGLGYEEVEQTLRRMLTKYKSHLDVDDDGNLRYRFDSSFTERGTEPGEWWHRTKEALWNGFVGFFKIWTMVMLVGYTIVFVLLLVGLSVAALTAGEDDDVGGDFVVLPFYFLARMLEFLFWWDLFSYGRMGRRARRMRRKSRKAKKPEKPFYEKIFRFLFGPDHESDPLRAERSFAQFVRSRDGRITAAEWASRSGQSLEAADNALTGGIMRFRGDVDVTDDGELVYRFDELRVTADEEQQKPTKEPPPIWRKKLQVPSLTGNPTSTNTWISVFNGFNLVMSSMVLFAVEGLTMAATIGLGWIPFIFSVMFFSLPLLRSIGHARKKKKAEKENRRREKLRTVFESADDGEADEVPEEEIPEELSERFMLDYDGDIDVTEDGYTYYTFPTVARQLEAGRRARERAATDEVVFGRTVFSSDEEEASLEEYEMDEFDKKLSRELGEDLTLADLETEAASEVESVSQQEYS